MLPKPPHPFGWTGSVLQYCSLVGGKERGIDRAQAEANQIQLSLHTCPTLMPATRIDGDTPPLSLSKYLSLFPTAFPTQARHPLRLEAMSTPAKIAIIFSVISSLLLVSRARFVPDGIFPFSTAVSEQDPLEITDRTAIVVRLEKSHGGSISAAIEPFHHVDLSLRHPIGRHIRRPINSHFLLLLRHGCHNHRHGRPGRREIPYGDDMIAFPRSPKIPRAFPGEMRSIPMMGPRIPRGFPNEEQPIRTGRPEFDGGFWKERAAMAHGMREAEGSPVAGEERMREKHEQEERADGDFAKRFRAIVNRF